ncbi:MAG TPA: GatB/YqeY domain-containing protein [Spirochaetota bacterium]|nr:GatB/YqeY domain-containing protein [Spirochaetota bacterium]HOR93163.1 GatB/YqeY domain-containing protein [Spirochaetota bacterium]HPD05092.1 GatB/YqeY domain-containing protein [Spirochaetota bacterium]HPK44432.1 GatB/YqeY domain-containing protein [Spirochaetota bacterium]HRR60257.1 GatB/YqeY domain-containing protein [Spirochaetota bacterium]
MSILTTIESNLKDAMKSKNELLSSTLRMMKSDILYEKTKSTQELTDEKIIEVLTRSAKRRKEAIAEYEKAGRDDLARKEKQELEIIMQYLPQQMSADEIASHVDAVIASMGTITNKDTGKVMGQVMKDLKGKADGQIVKQIVAQKLEKL